MTPASAGGELAALADAVLLPCFDGTVAPDWLRRRVAGSLGGVCLFARNVRSDEQLGSLTEQLRTERDDVVVAIDEEAGDVTRMDAGTGSIYPGNAALGRVDDVTVTVDIGRRVGRRLAAAGVTLNFAPCADVASDPANPVIGTRSFGPDPKLVARHTAAFVTGHQSAGIAACAKHFPGHGDTDADTHLQLAVLNGDLELLLSDALPPFTAAIDAGVAAVMAGHLLVPAVDTLPATVSGRWLTDILRGELGFGGLVVTDALEMNAISGGTGMAEGAVLALIAGADLLCLGGRTLGRGQLDLITAAITGAVRSGRLTEQRLADAAARVRRLASGWAGAHDTDDIDGGTGGTDLERPELSVARRALQVAGPLLPWREPVLVLRCADRPNIAVGDIPWGPASVDPSLTERVLEPDTALPEPEIARAGTVLLVTRDRHRRPWMSGVLARLRALRGDAVLLEMGGSGVSVTDAPAVASHGATMANTHAALQVLRSATGDTER